uniref:CGG triplet repeat-binding protein 1-like protein n=1 Tax=Callorhinchus milii TaxID=7868 RepID=V9LKF4_CALMI
MKSRKHCECKAATIRKKGGSGPQRQLALTTCFFRTTASSIERKEFILEFVRCLTGADILLGKAPACQEFLCKCMKQGRTVTTYLKELIPP